MKKAIIAIAVLISLSAKSQSGNLVADTTKTRTDTIYAKAIVYLEGLTLKVDSGYAVHRIAPLVFKSNDGQKSVPTTQETILSETIYILPKRKKIDQDLVIAFRRR